MDEGYIKLFRSMTDWERYQDSKTTAVFLHLLLNANWEDSRYRGYEVPRGSVVTGLHSLSESLGISIKSVRTALNHLKSTGEVTIKTTNRFSIVSIANWEKFQGNIEEGASQTASQVAHKGQTSGTQRATYKEYKEIKNIRREEERESLNPEEVQNLFNKICIFFKPCMTIGKSSLPKIRTLRQQYTLDEIREVFERANKSEFLKGKNDRSWKATFDWIITPENFEKIMDGNYDNSESQKSTYQSYIHGNYDFAALEKETRDRCREQ